MFDEGQNHVITIDLYISMCYYISNSQYVILCLHLMIYKEFFSLVYLSNIFKHSKLPNWHGRLAVRNR
jgi:hypothetical protein